MSQINFLIIDDNEAEHFLYRYTLESFDSNFKINAAYDGKQALDMLDSSNDMPDVIFLDINMPGMSGFEFLDIYESKNYESSPPVIMLTSSFHEKEKEKSENYKSVKLYISKPIKEVDIKKVAELIIK